VTSGTDVTAASEVAHHTLRTLIERLHPALFELVTAPRGIDVDVGDPVILDPSEPTPEAADAIVLAVGIDGDRSRSALLRRLAGSAAAVVFKHVGALDASVATDADDAGVAVLLAPPALSWGQLYTLLLTAGRRSPAIESAVTEAPLGDLFALADAIAARIS